MSPTITGGTIGTSPTCDSGLATCDLRRNNSIPGWRIGGGEYCTYYRMDNLFVQGFVSAGLPPVKQSRPGDCSGKSPNMQVAVAVRNMDWGFEMFPAPWGLICDLEKSLAQVGKMGMNGLKQSCAKQSRGPRRERELPVSASWSVLLSYSLLFAFPDRELSGRSVAVRRDLDVASMSGPSAIGRC